MMIGNRDVLSCIFRVSREYPSAVLRDIIANMRGPGQNELFVLSAHKCAV